jgi:hypothetical protein
MTAPTVSLSPHPKQQFFVPGQAGLPAAGAFLWTYAAGTTNKQNTYTDSTGATPSTNPIVLDSNGQCTYWLDQTLKYKFTLAPATDVDPSTGLPNDPPQNPLWTVDGVGNLTLLLQVNDIANIVQNKLDLKQGTNVSIVDNGDGSVTISVGSQQITDAITAAVNAAVSAAVVPYSIGLWISRGSPDSTWSGVAFGNGVYVTVADSTAMTSPDGINWTSRTVPADCNAVWNNVCFGNGLFVAVANTTRTGSKSVMTSPDGVTWTARTVPAVNQWRSVVWGLDKFVAVSNSGSGDRVMTSPDGITWTSRTSANDSQWVSVAYGNSVFVAVATSVAPQVMTSPDGITWTGRTAASTNSWQGIGFGNGLFVAVSTTGAGNRVMTSPDGITWTPRTSVADNSWFSVAYGNGVFEVVALTGSVVMTSLNGITWTLQPAAAANQWTGVCYSSTLNRFVAVASTGSGNRVMTMG